MARRWSSPKAISPTSAISAPRWCASATPIRTASILISYYSDGALIARQARQVGLKQTICAASSVYSPKFLELGGEAVEDVHIGTRYFPEDPRPEVQKFVTGFKAKYNGLEPDAFNAYSYDAMNMAAAVLRIGGTDRRPSAMPSRR